MRGPAEKWSRSSSTSIPLSSACRAKSSHARPARTGSLTIPNRNAAMTRRAITGHTAPGNPLLRGYSGGCSLEAL